MQKVNKDDRHPDSQDASRPETDTTTARRKSYEELNALLHDIVRRYPPLYYQDFQLMYEQYRRGRTPECRKEARDRMVYGNVRLAVYYVLGYIGRGLAVADLLSAALGGLERALESYDPGFATTFSTYATHWIRHYLRRAMHQRRRLIRLPVGQEQFLGRTHRTRAAFQAEHGREPSDRELIGRMRARFAQDAKLTIAIFEKRMRHGAVPVASFSTPIGEEGDATLGDVVSAPCESPEEAIDRTRLRTLIEIELEDWDLSDDYRLRRDAYILRLRFGLAGLAAETLEEIGERMRLTRERIRQIEKKALVHLLEALAEEGFLRRSRIKEIMDQMNDQRRT